MRIQHEKGFKDQLDIGNRAWHAQNGCPPWRSKRFTFELKGGHFEDTMRLGDGGRWAFD